jgi:hypothetical protein
VRRFVEGPDWHWQNGRLSGVEGPTSFRGHEVSSSKFENPIRIIIALAFNSTEELSPSLCSAARWFGF